MAVVSSPVQWSEAMFVGGGGGAPSLQQNFYHVHMATGSGKVDGSATLMVPIGKSTCS